MTKRKWAEDTDCSDCGSKEAEFQLKGLFDHPICNECKLQYFPEDITPVSSKTSEFNARLKSLITF